VLPRVDRVARRLSHPRYTRPAPWRRAVDRNPLHVRMRPRH
jgi:hypothetical protein